MHSPTRTIQRVFGVHAVCIGFVLGLACPSSAQAAIDSTAAPFAAPPVVADVPSAPVAPVSIPTVPATDSVVAPTAVADTAFRPAPAAPVKRSSLKRLPYVAILSFTGNGASPKDLETVTNRFETELMSTDSFKIVERRNIDRILREQGLQQSGACDNSECSVEIGQVLSVQGIFTGELSKVGKVWSLSVKRTDVGTGQTEFSHVLDIQGSLEDVLRGGIPEMAQIACGRKKQVSNRTVLVAKEGPVIWPWIAGGAAVSGVAALAAVLLMQDDAASATTGNTPVPSHNVTVTW